MDSGSPATSVQAARPLRGRRPTHLQPRWRLGRPLFPTPSSRGAQVDAAAPVVGFITLRLASRRVSATWVAAVVPLGRAASLSDHRRPYWAAGGHGIRGVRGRVTSGSGNGSDGREARRQMTYLPPAATVPVAGIKGAQASGAALVLGKGGKRPRRVALRVAVEQQPRRLILRAAVTFSSERSHGIWVLCARS